MKKTYQIPSVIAMQLMPSSIICVSGGSGAKGLVVSGETIGDGFGGD